MRISMTSLCLTIVATFCFSLAGCGGDSGGSSGGEGTNTSSSSGEHFEGDGHDHSEGDGHDHGDEDGHDHGEAGHEHPTEGPHGGHLIELGDEEYHAELLHDESTHKVAIHLLDGTGKKEVAVAAPQIDLQLFQDGKFVKYTLQPVQGSGGSASEFELVDAALCSALCSGDATKGRLQVTINGKPYTGTLEHASHGDHDHEGDEHAGHDHNES